MSINPNQKIFFSKMHGLGNDFMVVNGVTQNILFSSEDIRLLANRYLGIGFNQLLLVEPPFDPDIDFHYRIFNPDGSEVGQCGNGARCIAFFVRSQGLTNKRIIRISTKTMKMTLKIINEKIVSINMGTPNFNPQQVPFSANNIEKTYKLDFKNQMLEFGIVSMGNPHCVIQVENIHTYPIQVVGSFLEKHKCFPEGVNVNFMEVLNTKHIRLRVYERGTGETQACGSGACAAVAFGINQGILGQEVQVDLNHGTLCINWNGLDNPLIMTGPATHVYDGSIQLKNLLKYN